MSLELQANTEPTDDDRSQQQDEEDDAHGLRGANGGPLALAPTPPLPRSHFALQLRDGVELSPERERRAQSSPSFDQLKSPMTAYDNCHGTEVSPNKQLHLQVQKLKEALQVMRVEKDNEIAFLREQLAKHQTMQHDSDVSAAGSSRLPCESDTDARKLRLVPWMHSITERGDIQTSRLGRHASLKSARAIADLQTQHQQQQGNNAGVALAERIAAAFLNPVLSLPYLHSIQFGADLVELSAHVGALLEAESRCLSLKSPAYVFGDLHGNWADLSFFSQHLWRFGFGLTAGSFLFLGDYVDRGASSLECVAYLFAQKLLHPRKVFLLRGNHETRAVNGLEHYYGSGCFLSQCRARFGRDEGYIVWHQINHAFDRLPLAATIDNTVFCVHGGIHAVYPTQVSRGSRRYTACHPRRPWTCSTRNSTMLIRSYGWSVTCYGGDPAREEHEPALDPVTGFGQSVLRGGSAVSFGAKAISEFLESHRFSHILRAHEAHLDGVAVAKSAQVVTVFSTSKDHGLGEDATCGCLLVDRDRISAINRSGFAQQHALRRRRSVTTLQPEPGRSTISSMTDAPASAVVGRTASSTSLAARDERGESAGTASASSPTTSAAVAVTTPPRRFASAAASTENPGFGRTRHRTDQDESDSTDDEAPPTRATSSGSPNAFASPDTATTQRPSRRARNPLGAGPAAGGDDNNQSED